MSDDGPAWNEDALAKLEKIPFFARKMARKKIEQRAAELGKALFDAVTPAEALNRTLGYPLAGETRMTTAWHDGAAASGAMAIQIKASAALARCSATACR